MKVIDNVLISRGRIPGQRTSPQMGAIIAYLAIFAVPGMLVGSFWGIGGARLGGFIGFLLGILFAVVRVIALSSVARFKEDREYDEKTRFMLAAEYRDTHSASYNQEKQSNG